MNFESIMNRYRIAFAGVALTLAVGECGQTADTGGAAVRFKGPTGLNYWSEYGEQDQPGTISRGWVCFWGTDFVVWCDLWESGATQAGGASGPFAQAAIHYPGGGSLELQCDLAAGKNGEVRVGSDTYDLAAGYLFLVSGTGDRPRVKQLNRDLSGVDLKDNKCLKAFANGDAEMLAFFTQK